MLVRIARESTHISVVTQLPKYSPIVHLLRKRTKALPDGLLEATSAELDSTGLSARVEQIVANIVGSLATSSRTHTPADPST